MCIRDSCLATFELSSIAVVVVILLVSRLINAVHLVDHVDWCMHVHWRFVDDFIHGHLWLAAHLVHILTINLLRFGMLVLVHHLLLLLLQVVIH